MSYIKPDAFKEVIEGYFNGTNFYTDALFTNLITPESNKIYVDLNTNVQYRWSGSAYVQLGDIQVLQNNYGQHNIDNTFHNR